MSFLDMCHSSNAYLLGDEDYEDAFYEGPYARKNKKKWRRNKDYRYNKYHYHQNLNEELIRMGIMSEKDKLTIKFSTEKAHLFAINDQPLFWAPKKLVHKIVSPKEFFYIHKCFDIYKQLIIERREKQKKDGKTISFSDYLETQVNEDLDPTHIDDAREILQEALSIDDTERRDAWSRLLDILHYSQDYVSEAFCNNLKTEIIITVQELMETGEVRLDKDSATLMDWGS